MISLRKATVEDLHILRRWDEEPHVVQSDPNDEWHWEVELQREPEWRQFLIALKDNAPIGFVQIIDPLLEETHYWGDVPENLRAIDIWIGERSALGQGYGTQIMKQALQICFADGHVSKVIIDPLTSNTRAHRFYERLGFVFSHEQQFGEDLCRFYFLTRSDFEKVLLNS